MLENTENIRIDENILVLNDDNVLYEINGVAYSLNELKAFIETSTELSRKVGRQTRFIEALKLNNGKLTVERNKLCDKCREQSKQIQDLSEENFKRIEESNRLFGELMDIKALSMWEFANKYCSDEELEEAGHALARSLGVGQ
jgi:hypothetical protein